MKPRARHHATDRIRTALGRAETDPVNAFVFVDRTGTLAGAETAGRMGGLWDGMPLGVKDNIAVAGQMFSAGIGAYRDRVAERDAEVIAALRAKGAVMLGKCNMHEAALGTTNDNPWFGRCLNPLNHAFVPGGSSGGSAAAVGAGIVPLALGTDTMGSVRIPAAFCGVWGYKPGPGLLSQEGVVPLSQALDTIGLIAESCTQLVEYGADLAGVTVSAPEVPRIGILNDAALAACTPEIQASYITALNILRMAGADLRPVPWFDDPSANRRAGLGLVVTEAYAAHAAAFGTCPQGFSPELSRFLSYGRDVAPDKRAQYQKTLAELRRDIPPLWARVDAVLTPVTPSPAHRFDTPAPDNLADFTAPANLIGLPATAMPATRTEAGTGIGLQLIGKRGGDGALLGITRALTGLFNSNATDGRATWLW